MPLTHPDTWYATVGLLPDPERRDGPAAALETRETDPLAAATTGRGERGQTSTQIGGGLLEHLGAHLIAPAQTGRHHLHAAVRIRDQQPAGVSRPLPPVEQVDQIKPRPRHHRPRTGSPGIQRVLHQPKALVEGETSRTGVPPQHAHQLRRRVHREPEPREPPHGPHHPSHHRQFPETWR
jgi:hypothetical protein